MGTYIYWQGVSYLEAKAMFRKQKTSRGIVDLLKSISKLIKAIDKHSSSRVVWHLKELLKLGYEEMRRRTGMSVEYRWQSWTRATARHEFRIRSYQHLIERINEIDEAIKNMEASGTSKYTRDQASRIRNAAMNEKWKREEL